MRRVEIEMDWRRFGWVFLILLVLQLSASGIVVAKRSFDGLFCAILLAWSFAFSLLLATAITGVSCVFGDWKRGKVRRSDFVVPLLFLLAFVIWLSLGFLHPMLPGFVELGFWAIGLAFLTVEAVSAWKKHRGREEQG